MTDEQIQMLLELCKKATPGPWHAADRNIGWEVHGGEKPEECWGKDLNCLPINNEFRECFEESDAAFIAAARTALPQALRELQTLRQARGESEKQLSEAKRLLALAVEQVRVWNGMGMDKESEKVAWDIYWNNSPEMKPLRAFLSRPAGSEKEGG